MYMRSLEELYLQCRNKASQDNIEEAVNCYKIGAYRACIVATWIALVYDFIEKVNELSLTGDKVAIELKEKIENIRKENDISAFLTFEKAVLKEMMEKFELLSPIECKILERLNEDRNLCAHPSMVGEGTPFKATAELARYHLINVIDFVLSKPPVQGKSALENTLNKLESDYYPKERNKIKIILAEGPLGRSKESLKRQFLMSLLYKYVSNIESKLSHEKYLNTLVVFWELNKIFIGNELSKYAQNKLHDGTSTDYWKICELLGNIPELYHSFNETTKISIKNYISQDAPVFVLSLLSSVNELEYVIQQRINGFDDEQVFEFIQRYPDTNPILNNLKYSIDKLIELFKNSGNFRQAEERFKKILYFVPRLTQKHLNEIIEVSVKNDQISGAFRLGELHKQLFKELDKTMIEKIIYDKLINFYFYEDIIKIIESKNPVE